MKPEDSYNLERIADALTAIAMILEHKTNHSDIDDIEDLMAKVYKRERKKRREEDE